ncbi:unnamed protein product [Adineta steineri]|uniref:Uncharacterized protein n=1 Tax=Adineta steineri TaxID=433720 RepID=A0A815NQ84_9BILA|nr:unnamed protein product [Adineta steineri]CAF1436829.1 unnamed protein product [Adineta steineri]
MEKNLIFELEQQLNNLDIDSNKVDAIIQLKIWQKKMFSLIEKIYLNRLNEIDTIALNITNEIKDKQNQLENIQINDKTTLLKLQHEIDQLKSDIIIDQMIPENLYHQIERTIHIKRDENQDDDDDDLVIIDIENNEEKNEKHIKVVLSSSTTTNSENRVSKIFKSEPVQQALTIGLTQTLTHMGTMAATSTTTIAATAIAKTALLTTAGGIGAMAYGIGRVAAGTTIKLWSFVNS